MCQEKLHRPFPSLLYERAGKHTGLTDEEEDDSQDAETAHVTLLGTAPVRENLNPQGVKVLRGMGASK